jgi:hypothetical protein
MLSACLIRSLLFNMDTLRMYLGYCGTYDVDKSARGLAIEIFNALFLGMFFRSWFAESTQSLVIVIVVL